MQVSEVEKDAQNFVTGKEALIHSDVAVFNHMHGTFQVCIY